MGHLVSKREGCLEAAYRPLNIQHLLTTQENDCEIAGYRSQMRTALSDTANIRHRPRIAFEART
jgi:hypothetical protein